LHGFTASRQETAPTFERLAAGLQANLFYARLTGHGLGADAIGAADLADWLADAEEAWQIGTSIGQRVVIVGTSMGAMLAAWLAYRHPAAAALVQLSPNYRPADAAAPLLALPGGRRLARMVLGRYRDTSVAENPPANLYWTNRHDTRSLVPMMQLSRLGSGLPLEKFAMPTLVVYTSTDRVVSVPAIERAFRRIGTGVAGQRKRLVDLPGAHDHVLGGWILSPDTTQALCSAVRSFLEEATNLIRPR
jgi:pimeloyl-ACP methyl ester carboxylesterase